MANQKVTVKKHAVKKWEVSKTIASETDTVEWSPTETDITIWFPPGRDPVGIGQITLRKGETLIKFPKKLPNDKEKTDVEYHYSVFCHESNEMAEGNSPPTIIIK